MGRERAKMVYGRPDDSYRNTYLDIMWVEDAKRITLKGEATYCPIYNTLESTINAALELVAKRVPLGTKFSGTTKIL